MKFIIKQILLALTLISIIIESQSDENVRKERLSRTYRRINENRDEGAKSFDMSCVKDFFKLPQSDKMIINELEEMVFDAAVRLKCSDEEKYFQHFFDNNFYSRMSRDLPCFKWNLHQLEPESKLIENFEIGEDDHIECILDEIQADQKKLEELTGPLNVFSCGAVTGAEDYVKFIAKGALIKYGDGSDELKKDEMQKLKEYYKTITITTANCIMQRFEDDPIAFLVNDTLNYHFDEGMKPVEFNPGEEYQINKYKNIEMVQNTIDKECVKEKLNLPENGHKVLLDLEASILIASAKSKCIKTNLIDFAEAFLKYAVLDFQKSEKHVSCANYIIQKFEKAIAPLDDEDHKHCEDYYMNIDAYTTLQFRSEDVMGPLNETTCGTFTNEIVEVISAKTILLSIEKNEELKKNKIMELFKYATDKLDKFADCVLGRI